MTPARLILLLLLILVAVVVVLVVLRRGSAQRDAQRVEAAGLRADADTMATTVAGQSVFADQAAQRAELARVEAEDKASEAARLEAEAAEHRAAAEASQRDYEATLRRADDIDPDVKQSEFPAVADEVEPARRCPDRRMPRPRPTAPGARCRCRSRRLGRRRRRADDPCRPPRGARGRGRLGHRVRLGRALRRGGRDGRRRGRRNHGLDRPGRRREQPGERADRLRGGLPRRRAGRHLRLGASASAEPGEATSELEPGPSRSRSRARFTPPTARVPGRT